MKRLIALSVLSAAFAVGSSSQVFAAANPSGQGPPSQTCLSSTAPMTPGNSSPSPGSPFNEPSGSNPGGTGGQNYSEKSQYDVACYQVSQSHG